MPRNLHSLPRLSDRWSYIYFEHGRLEKENEALVFLDAKGGASRVPLDQFATIMLGPGTTLTHAAARMLADNNTLLIWSGEEGVRFYSFGTGGTHSAARLLAQIGAWADPQLRLGVIRRCTPSASPRSSPRGPRWSPFAPWRATEFAISIEQSLRARVSPGMAATTTRHHGTALIPSTARSLPPTHACTGSATPQF